MFKRLNEKILKTAEQKWVSQSVMISPSVLAGTESREVNFTSEIDVDAEYELISQC